MSDQYFDEENDLEREIDPSFAELLQDLIQSSSSQMNVAQPATVVSYNYKNQTVTVTPDFKKKYPDGTIVDSPSIYTVPVSFHRTSSSFIALPLKKGDKVTLIFADRSLDKWKTQGVESHPEDDRMHHISDCYAIPGGYPLNNSSPLNNPDDVIIKNENMEVRLKPNGHIQILNQGEELLTMLDDYMTADIAGDYYSKVEIQVRLRTMLEK